MSETRPSMTSLDALLESSRQQFDQTFADRLKEADAAGLRDRSRGAAGAVTATPAKPAAAKDTDIDQELDRRFGRDWSAELVETQITGQSLSALYRLTAGGRSALEFGDGSMGAGEEAALEAARQKALAKAADSLAHGAKPSATSRSAAALPTPDVATRAAPAASGAVNTVMLDRIESAWRQIRKEMGVVLGQMAVAESVRQKAGEAATLTDARGATLAGKPVSAIAAILKDGAGGVQAGDVYLVSDPYAGSTAGCWTVISPAFSQGTSGDLVGFSAVSAPMADTGGSVPGSAPNGAASVFAEGLRIPLVKIFENGAPNAAAMDVILGNTRHPNGSHGDLRALAAAAHAGAEGLTDLCARFGVAAYRQAGRLTMERTQRAIRKIIAANLPQEPKSFEDVVDSDGLGNGPFTIKLAIWREGEQAYFDWTGSSPQAPGPINLNLDDATVAHMAGALLISVFDPEIAVNDGLVEPLKTTLPAGSIVNPRYPAPLANNAHTLARVYDVLNGAMGQIADQARSAAGYGSSPQLAFYGENERGQPFYVADRVFGGTPGKSGKDGQDGRSLSSGSKTRPTEQTESDGPVVIESVSALPDSGGVGQHRGGNGVEKVYRFKAAGQVNWRDDREQSRPWGRDGGQAGACSSKLLIRADGTRETMPSKVETLEVSAGDRLFFRTAGGGGWGNPLDRDPEQVQKDVRNGLVSTAAARDQYGVALTGLPETCHVEEKATRDLRETLRRSRGKRGAFDFGR